MATGLTVTEAKGIMNKYLADSLQPNAGGVYFGTYLGAPDIHSNCTLFSQWFLKNYTTDGIDLAMPSGDGCQMAQYLVNKNAGKLAVSNTPVAFSVFSINAYNSTYGTQEHGHTGIVLGIDGDNVITGEANYGRPITSLDALYDGVVVRTHSAKTFNSSTGVTFVNLNKYVISGLGGTSDVAPQILSATIENNNDTGKFDVRVKTNPVDSITVKVPIWPDGGSQVWYDAQKVKTGEYLAHFDYANHNKEEGIYHVHAYAYNGGKRVGYPITDTLEVKNTSSIAPQILSVATEDNNGTGTFKVRVKTNLVDSITVKLPIWSERDGQNDIVWYVATKVKTGEYLATFNAANHGYEAGRYHVHVYAYNGDKKLGMPYNDNLIVNMPTWKLTAASGTHTFTARGSVKAEPKLASAELAYYNIGDSVIYDYKTTYDGYEWISYIAGSGLRRFIATKRFK